MPIGPLGPEIVILKLKYKKLQKVDFRILIKYPYQVDRENLRADYKN